MPSTFQTFTALHVPGDPLVLYNTWDPGSALAVAEAGAKALATGSHPVGDASGHGDGQQVPLSYVFADVPEARGCAELAGDCAAWVAGDVGRKGGPELRTAPLLRFLRLTSRR